jgi:hypothetical protein
MAAAGREHCRIVLSWYGAAIGAEASLDRVPCLSPEMLPLEALAGSGGSESSTRMVDGGSSVASWPAK